MPAVIVDSSWIDMLAGLAKSSICRTPPDFCAAAGAPFARVATSQPSAIKHSHFRPICPSCFPATRRFFSVLKPPALFVEPDVFHAPAVVDAVGHLCVALDPGLPAAGPSRVD